MPNFKPGDRIAINSAVSQGPFPGEFLVTIDTASGPLSGFVKEDQIVRSGEKTALIGTIREVSRDNIEVWLQGSFFTSTGLADLPADWAKNNVRTLAAA